MTFSSTCSPKEFVPASAVYRKAVGFSHAFDEVIHVPDCDMDPEDYLRELIEVYSGCSPDALGNGVYAEVYDAGDSTVFKVGTATEGQSYLEYFANWSKDNPFFPVVYWSAMVLNADQEAAAYIIHMERLIPMDHPTVDTWRVGNLGAYDVLGELIDSIEGAKPIKVPNAPDTYYEACKIIHAIVSGPDAWLDLHDGNFMFRPDGQLVITDPVV